MTPQQIQALIDAKIKGQGSAIDIGGALPAILGGLNEAAAKAVSVDSTDMTEKDQMQIRKNLGLYYEIPEIDNSVQYDGNPEGKELYKDGALVRLSEDIPTSEDILTVKKNEEEITATTESFGDNDSFLIKDESISIFVIIAGEETGDYAGLPTGIYGYTASPEYALTYKVADAYVEKIPSKYLPDMPTPGTSDAVQYVPQELTAEQQAQARTNIGAGTSNFNGNPVLVTGQSLTESQKMQARKNQGLYYEGIEIAEQNLTLTMYSNSSKTYTWKGVAFYFQWDNINRTPYPAPINIADVLSFGWKASGQTTEMDVVVGENAALIAEGVYVLYGPDADPETGPSSGADKYQYCIVAFEGNEENLDAGFYYAMYDEMHYPTKYIDSVKYLGEETVINKIPQKFLPDTSGEQEIYLKVNDEPYYGSPYIEVSGNQYDEYGMQIRAPFDIDTVTVKYAKTKGAWATPSSSITADFSSDSWKLNVEVGATSEMVEVFLEITSDDGSNYGKIVTLEITNQD